tara:strand:- start:51 stop:344 length:294 start_codon:yes stop_codon:yes gene_type:complete
MLNFLNSLILKWALLLVVLCLQFHVWFSDSGYSRYSHIQNKIVDMKLVNQNYKNDIVKLKKAVDDLNTDGKLLDGNARENLGMIGPGETLYRVSFAS